MEASRFKTRKQRIHEHRVRLKQKKKLKFASYVIAGTLATSAFVTVNVTGKEAANVLVHRVQSGDTLYSLAIKYGVTIKGMKEANGLKSDLIKVGQELLIPEEKSPGSNYVEGMSHKVVSGETLSSIARKYGITVAALKKLNGLHTDRIMIGQNLTISNDTSLNNTYLVTSGDTLYSIGNKFGVSLEKIKKLNKMTSDKIYVGQRLTIPSKSQEQVTSGTPKTEVVSEAYYMVAPGDTLWGIAKRFHTTATKIKNDNNLKSEHVIIGQRLKIKGTGLVKSRAVITGIVDNKSIELLLDGEKEPIVLRVAYGTATNYDIISGAKIKIIYKHSVTPALVDLVFANESFNY
ncbi:LysM peptidoglycan-binding domain-containing protein [Sutcliffiella sp. NPDC057660]|uniref:LysM peptidoglycan-binding domain-containing protein n=1 Tax=Sutcliffiella sp. NPDC057660 TaxID=3346199 RepID=UPI0036A18D76